MTPPLHTLLDAGKHKQLRAAIRSMVLVKARRSDLDQHAVEQLTNDAFMAVYRMHVSRRLIPEQTNNYVHGVIRHKLVDLYRSASRERLSGAFESRTEAPAHFECVHRLNRVCDTLDEAQRHVVALKLEGHSRREIAAMMGIGEKKVRRSLNLFKAAWLRHQRTT